MILKHHTHSPADRATHLSLGLDRTAIRWPKACRARQKNSLFITIKHILLEPKRAAASFFRKQPSQVVVGNLVLSGRARLGTMENKQMVGEGAE
jgi:hypothetical protein